MRQLLFMMLALSLTQPTLMQADEPAATSEEFFEERIRPLLAGTCVACHGPQKVSGGLRLDTREALLQGGDSGHAIDEEQPEQSLLLRAVQRDDDVSPMPPDEQLTAAQVADLRAWLHAGAPWPEQIERLESAGHWAFEPIDNPPLPQVQSTGWAQTGVDVFIQAALEAAGREPLPPADRRTWLRRVTYDLTGLPPVPQAVAEFEADTSPQAYAAVIDRLLASPAYGEHWGRHWLDVVRYADTAGENTDHPLPHAWRYRNWVIQAFNDDLPYDEFIRWQVAGDLLAVGHEPHDASDRIVATGYLAIARRFGHDIDKDMHLTLEDTIDTLGKSVLGLTLGCCRCHDHKYDPLTARDYYGLYGIFASTRFAFPGCEPVQQPRDLVALPLAGDPDDPAATPVAYAVSEGEPHDAHLQLRGNPDEAGEIVPRKFLDILGGQHVTAADSSGRLELAHWLTDSSNPLTARVVANRVWQWHFGEGLVATANDFGTRGARPSHPELLDYLASQLIRSGWSLKGLHREILLSATYQQAPRSSNAASSLYEGFPRRRLTAEELRDTLLSFSGNLDRSQGQSHPFPPESTWSFTQHNPFADEYETARRSVYVMQKRNRRSRFFALFDGADPNASTARREVTTVPTQALYFLNDPFFHAQAQGFADRVLAASPADEARLDTATRILFGRDASTDEHDQARAFRQAYVHVADEVPHDERNEMAWRAYLRAMMASNEVLHVD